MNDTSKFISASDFTALTHSRKDMVVIDVRTVAEVNSEYLESCHNLPLQDIDTDSFKSILNKSKCKSGKPVYLLCGTGMRATKALEQLSAAIDNPLLVIEGGINALKQAGVTMKQGGGSVISLDRQVRIAAGLLVVSGVVLGSIINPLLYGLSAFVGVGLVFAGVTNTCGMAMILARMPWNRAS